MHKFDCNAHKSFKRPVWVEPAKLPIVICTVVDCATPVCALVIIAAAANMGMQPLSPETNACESVAVGP